MADEDGGRRRDRWARFRFSVVGPLLAAPPARGELQQALEQLCETTWRHPIRGEPVRFGLSTIERWYHTARQARDPVAALRPAGRRDSGQRRSLSTRLLERLQAQYAAHSRWSYQLHADNLAALVREDSSLGPAPSYSTVLRAMKSLGMVKRRTGPRRRTAGAQRARERLEQLEVRSFEAEYVHGLWHLDFHQSSRKVVTPAGAWLRPMLLGVLDDRSRLACHVQWYLAETTEMLVHGLMQAIHKRGLPRALMSDNGPAMLADEFTCGLAALGIVHETTLPYSAYQNGKQENFWAQVEGRLLAMLEGCEQLDLELLNTATQAWVEQEYNRKHHSEIHTSPLARYLEGPDVGRDSPDSDTLRRAFRTQVTRTQRRSDGTISLEGRRFEIPSRYRQLTRLHVRYARWDLGAVDLVDPQSGLILAPLFPLDKSKNADARRRRLEPVATAPVEQAPAGGIAPLLRQLIAEYAATGLPPAYLPWNSPDEEPRR